MLARESEECLLQLEFFRVSVFGLRTLLRQVAKFQIPEPDLTAVFLQEKMAFGALAKAADVLELAVGHGGFDFVAAAGVFEDFHAVEPVFDVVALDENA